MSKICAKCEKPVYPLEELKCLDKIWHKGCFKCWECGMSLNMKNYKGFDRKPYCSAHYPQTKATVVADTPELQRLSQASKNQSQTAYHNEYEKSKGKYTQVADDPELVRLLRNQETISMAKYHEDFEKNIKGSKIQVADDPETQRLKQLSSVVSQVEYKGLREKVMDMEAKRQNLSQPAVPEKSVHRSDNYPTENQKPSPYSNRNVSHSTVYSADGRVESQPQRKIGSIADYDPTNYSSTVPHSSLRQTQEWEETVVFAPQNFPSLPRSDPPSSAVGHHYSSLDRPASGGTDGISPSAVGHMDVKPYGGETVADGKPVASLDLAEDQDYLAQQQQQQLREQQQLKEQQLRQQQLQEQQQQEQKSREQQLLQQQRQQQQQHDQHQAPYEQMAQNVQHVHGLTGAIFQAMYDYDAQDEDEVSFVEDDLVVNCDPIDEGWMYGTIQRTGQRGMLPANYVERVQ